VYDQVKCLCESFDGQVWDWLDRMNAINEKGAPAGDPQKMQCSWMTLILH